MQTDEEQMWLEQQMQQAESKASASAPARGAPDVSDAGGPPEEDFEEPPTPSNAAKEEPAEKSPGDYDDVMKLIEENRRKNEAKRAAQSARNAEIIAAFEQRQGAGGGQ